MASWPATLPTAFDGDNFSYLPETNVLTTKMDTGPVKMRPRFTAVSTLISGTLFLSHAQVSTLLTFYKTTTVYGTDPFDWTDPITGASEQFRFLVPPEVVGSNGSYATVALSLEMLP